jgi:molecular chaperone GrpE
MSDEQKNEESAEEQIVEVVEISPLKKCEAEAAEYKLSWQRAVADYQNLKKETQSRRAEWVEMSEQQILEEFIPVYDHFKAAFSHHPDLNDDQKNIKNWIDGIGYIMKQFGDVLKAHGVEEIKTVGEMFDTTYHESAGEEVGEKTGKIIKEVSGGYKMGNRVIKPARVIISK